MILKNLEVEPVVCLYYSKIPHLYKLNDTNSSSPSEFGLARKSSPK